MDNFKLIDFLNKTMILSFEERNVLYFKIKSIVEDGSPDEASRTILSKIVDILSEYKTTIENKILSESSNSDSSEGKEFKGIFRRVPS